jgi:ubiquinone biosynthesis protein UbiJ
VASLPNPAPLLAGQILTAGNHLLRGQPWLRQRLQPFAGRVAMLEVFPVELLMAVTAEGELEPAGSGAAADVVVRVPLAAALGFASGDERARAQIGLSGDPAFAAVLGGVLRELRWDVEEDLSRVVGDIAARRIVQTGQSFLAWQRQTASNILQALAEYLTEERPVLAQRHELEHWVREVDDLRDAAERLEKRIARLDSSRR